MTKYFVTFGTRAAYCPSIFDYPVQPFITFLIDKMPSHRQFHSRPHTKEEKKKGKKGSKKRRCASSSSKIFPLILAGFAEILTYKEISIKLQTTSYHYMSKFNQLQI